MSFNANINYPKITIVTPSFNQADFLEETILSIINQNYPNLEYIIIDGGSTDNSVEIIKKYENHINYWVSEKDFGQSHAINKGFARATGEVLNWINSDDLLCENALFEIGKAYLDRKNDNIVIIGYGYDIDEKSNKTVERRVSYDSSNPNSLLNIKGNPIQQSVFYSKKLFFEAGGINPILRYPMDLEMYFKFGLIKPETVIVEKYLACFRKHTNSKTISQDYKMLLEKINLIEFQKFYAIDKSLYKNQISAYITSSNFHKFTVSQKINLALIFNKNTPFYRKNFYKFRIILEKLIYK